MQGISENQSCCACCPPCIQQNRELFLAFAGIIIGALGVILSVYSPDTSPVNYSMMAVGIAALLSALFLSITSNNESAIPVPATQSRVTVLPPPLAAPTTASVRRTTIAAPPFCKKPIEDQFAQDAYFVLQANPNQLNALLTRRQNPELARGIA